MTNDKPPTGRRVRLVLTAVTLAVPASTVVVSWMLWHAGLHERVAFHWTGNGRVDGTILAEPLFAMAMTGTALGLAIGVILLLVPRIDPKTRRGSMFWLGSIPAFVAAMWLVPAGLTYHAGSREGARLEGWGATFFLALLYGIVPYLLMPKTEPASTRTPRTITLKPTEVGAWSATVSTGLLYVVALAVAGLAVGVNVPALAAGDFSAVSILGLAVMVLAVVALLSFASLRVTVDWRGLRVVSLLTRVPVKRIPLDRVRDVEVTDLHPAEWGGWGYRVMSGRTAVILRSGPGMVVTTRDGKQFALSLRNPETPAGLLHTLAGVASRTQTSGHRRDREKC